MSFTVIPATDVPETSSRVTKTSPLRNALAALQIGEAIEVSYETHDAENGYKATTISQIAGTMSSKSSTVKFSVRKKPDGTGCFLIATEKPDPAAKKRGRKPKSDA
jgi:hypothetical protein